MVGEHNHETGMVTRSSLMESFGGNWERFFAAVYHILRRILSLSKPDFRGKRFGPFKRFWSMTASRRLSFLHDLHGEVEAGREPDLRRCERIHTGPKPVIEDSYQTLQLKVWAEPKETQRIHIWF